MEKFYSSTEITQSLEHVLRGLIDKKKKFSGERIPLIWNILTALQQVDHEQIGVPTRVNRLKKRAFKLFGKQERGKYN